jgi:F-type H+-transporting ATPase subunit alpha
MLKQPQYSPLSVPNQIALLVALNHGLFDRLPLDTMRESEQRIRQSLSDQFADVSEHIRQGSSLDANDIEHLISLAERSLSP